MNGTLGVEGYPHGTEITFRCIASIMGEKTTWKLICEQGNWVGKSFNCGKCMSIMFNFVISAEISNMKATFNNS